VRLTRIVLASASPRRYELLRSLGLCVDVVASGYHEPDLADVAPAELATRHAGAKLRKVLQERPAPADVPVLAADTVVDLEGAALGKPADAAEAARMLAMLSSRDHSVHTAFALALPGSSAWIEECATTRVRFYALTALEIAEYVSTGEPFDKAGGYGIQGRAASLVESIDGDFYAVMGLPLARVIRALRRSGFELPEPNERSPFLRTETNADSLH
jgi:septum formation protein